MGKKILIVDDSATARLLVKMCLNKIGDFEIIEAGTGEKALELARLESVDICILDYNMPVMVGTELARELQKVCKEVSYILITANMQQAVISEAEDVGFSAFIEKPVDGKKISEALEKIQ